VGDRKRLRKGRGIRLHQAIRFCTAADGTSIAYATIGHGPPLVKAPHWLTHLEYEAESVLWRHWLQELSRDHQFLRLDQRGCGLSDRDVKELSFEAYVSDLETVVDAAGFERFPLLGASQGGAVAIEYAFRHPERVSQLVLFGAFAHLPRSSPPAEREALDTLIRQRWGQDDPAYRHILTSRFMPTASQEEWQSFNHLQRVSTTGDIVVRTLASNAAIDVTDRLRRLSVPTLVLHSVGDRLVPFSAGRTLAANIPNARLVTLESQNHWLLAGEPAWQTFLSEVRAFLDAGSSDEAARSAQPPSTALLSQREIEVIRLIAAGRSNPEIARELFITRNTVQNHVSNILTKLDLQNRAQAAAYAKEHGIA
jgi:pimeloyl-ACP methyl ester carboxylesterase/DNA-binding CsgD family transcriptional regulator